MRRRFVFAVLLAGWVGGADAASAPSVLLEDMTWPEVRDALAHGKTTVLVPTGGTEQTGPHIVLGKHNFVQRETSRRIAEKLGDALVAPLVSLVPEGSITPPEGNMLFPGTISLSPATFALLLEDTARSLRQHGFKTICFIGEHGGSQQVQKEVAHRLSAEWQADHVKVIQVSDYYDAHNGQNAYLETQGEKDPDPQAHGGLADTSEMLAVYPQGVRNALRGAYGPDDFKTIGADGASNRASAALGMQLVELKIESAVRQIKKERLSE